MGTIRAAYAMSHSPGMTGFPEIADASQATAVHDAFDVLRRHLAGVGADVLVGISVDHFTNFSLGNLPTFAIGSAGGYTGPSAGLAGFLRLEPRTFPGHATLGKALLTEAIRAGFDPSSVGGDFVFDENFCVPLHFLGAVDIPFVPIIVNAVEPPYPSLRRCWQLGCTIGRFLEAQSIAERVVLMATGGLSHSVGTPEAGRIDVGFDRRVLALLAEGKAELLADLPPEDIDRAGNGAQEVRAWTVLAGAVGSALFDVLVYEPIPEWLTGTAAVTARLGNEQRGG
ncbi:MAG: hypothetical protein ACRDZQ_01220 [Acidimicrobiales bacterium]